MLRDWGHLGTEAELGVSVLIDGNLFFCSFVSSEIFLWVSLMQSGSS
jgi:hypothetical protein